MMLFNAVSKPLEMLEAFKEAMAEDFLHRARTCAGGNPARDYDGHIFGQALRELGDLLQAAGGNGLADFGLHLPAALPPHEAVANERRQQRATPVCRC